MAKWTPARIEELRKLRELKLSIDEIADRCSIKRGAVIGAIHRYLGGGTFHKRGDKRKRQAPPAPKPQPRPSAAPLLQHNQFTTMRPITLPRVSIQARDDFSDADVRAGMADRAWTEKDG